MDIEKIKVRAENGQVLEVVVLNKRADSIEVVIGAGEEIVACDSPLSAFQTSTMDSTRRVLASISPVGLADATRI